MSFKWHYYVIILNVTKSLATVLREKQFQILSFFFYKLTFKREHIF